MRILFTLLMFSVALSIPLAGQEFTVMFYNVENLFDTEDDSTRNDEEFLPDGSRRWTLARYQKKLSAIARAVAATGGWDLPSVIGLCEVENEKVVRDLAHGTILSAGNYGIVHRDSPDPRGIDLALLYKRDRFTVTDTEVWLPSRSDSIPVMTRNILYVRLASGEDTLHVVLCHLPSRRGGVLAAGELREKMAQLAAGKIESVLDATDGKASLVLMGDFNAAPTEPVMSVLTEGTDLINLSADLAKRGKGSYRYQGTWEMIDQVLVSGAMTDTTSLFYAVPGSFRVVDPAFLLTDDEIYPGLKPFPTYGGYRWQGGYSDHLPVTVKIRHRRE
ncbi:MAG: endonuclease/exonuclease/phosphatase family protein [Bacteroidales bacterium]|jgi:predicted extracellular nuclease|nr:endonuclease/exonuclease/phosphatase family protein [Bacteroidales bacterium]